MIFKQPSFGGSWPGRGDFDHRHAGTTSAIFNALAAAVDIDSAGITVIMVDETVVLEGVAPSRRDIERAIEVAEAIVGGIVRNRIWQTH
jgi:osmotically-inducible protein OsmY